MSRETFEQLVRRCKAQGGLKDTRKISAGEKVMIFLYILSGQSNRSTQERWQHSGDSISNVVKQVRAAILRLKLLVSPDLLQPSDVISRNPKYYPFFKDCIGAFDGTHIPAVIGADARDAFINRKGFTSQNVLGVVNFDMTFSYILAGWEGCAHDGRVLADAKTKGMLLPRGKYYLGDAGYALSSSCLTPYRGVRYHLKEWESGERRPQSPQELFNLRHSSLRNVIERSFGVVKKRFPILNNMPAYPFPVQVELVMCCFYLHNFIRVTQVYEDEFDNWTRADEEEASRQQPGTEWSGVDNRDCETWRDSIAADMYRQYENYLAERI
jgi:hypothetical protein